MQSIAIAEAVARCRPNLVCAYPGLDTRITDALTRTAGAGDARLRIVRLRSAHAALAAAIGAAAKGARTYVASGGDELLSMAQPLYDAAALGMPVVMTVANRALACGAGSDHSDSMAVRDGGWIQLYAASPQEAIDVHLQAFRVAEELDCPVMVCVDGDGAVDAAEPAEVPSQRHVDAFLPPYEPRPATDRAPAGAVPLGPDAFTEARYLVHHKQLRALQLIPQLAAAFAAQFGRASGGLIRAYRTGDAESVVVALGAVNGIVQDVVDELRDDGEKIGSVAIGSFRPFPLAMLRETLERAKRVVVLEKCLAIGQGGIVSEGVRKALADIPVRGYTVIAGLGGRPIASATLRQLLVDACADELEQVTFLDLNAEVVARELEREKQARRGG